SRRCSSLSRMSFIERIPRNSRQNPYHGGRFNARIALAGRLRHEARMASPPAPSSPQQALQDALALHREGKHEDAMKGYVALLQRNPGNLDALYSIAVLAIQQEQFAEGMKVIGRALDISPKQAR